MEAISLVPPPYPQRMPKSLSSNPPMPIIIMLTEPKQDISHTAIILNRFQNNSTKSTVNKSYKTLAGFHYRVLYKRSDKSFEFDAHHANQYFYSLSRKTANTRENFWSVYCFATNQKRDETTRDNGQTAAYLSHDLI